MVRRQMMKRKNETLHPDAPLKHAAHKRPITRRDLISQGFMTGAGVVTSASLFSLFANPRSAFAQFNNAVTDFQNTCGGLLSGAGKIPFICFDLAGGANIAGSNVLIGGSGGQLDFLSTEGYNKLGLPGDRAPNTSQNGDGTTTTNFVDQSLGLAFHSESAILTGIKTSLDATRFANVNGCIVPARSDNDTGNNPHNPSYAIAQAGAAGGVATLIGSRSSVSGGNSMAPELFIDPELMPTKVDRPSDVSGLVDVGDLVGVLEKADAVKVMQTMQRISDLKFARIDAYNTAGTNAALNAQLESLLNCSYLKSAGLAEQFSPATGQPNPLEVSGDPDILAAFGVNNASEFDSLNGEYRKTASIMKMVVEGHSGAGTVTMGGYDYHTGDRRVGEPRDYRVGRCIGACLEYAARKNVPIMIYVFSDGSVASNGNIDDGIGGNYPVGGEPNIILPAGKGEWTGDNSSTASSFFLVYDPVSAPQLIAPSRNQIGYMRADASTEVNSSPMGNNVNLLVNWVLLNYMALHGEQGNFAGLFPGNNHGLGNIDLWTAFQPLASIQNGVINTSGS